MDLNLLKTFDAVMKARSVNVAAEALGSLPRRQSIAKSTKRSVQRSIVRA